MRLFLNVTFEMVVTEVRNMKSNKSCGPDEIHPKMLKELIDFVSSPITILLNKTMLDGVIPDYWKNAFVTPI